MKANKAFYFSYPNGIGDVHNTTETMSVDFEKHAGHGICFREGVDFSYNGENELHLKVEKTAGLVLRLEFKTVASGGCADTMYCDISGEHTYALPLFLSPLREVVVAALRSDNEEVSEGEYSVPVFEMI